MYRRAVHGESPQDAASSDERGNRLAMVAGVVLLDADGRERQVFGPGDDLTVEIDIVPQAPIDDWCVGCAVNDDRDVMLFGTNTVLREMELPALAGPTKVRFRFGRIPLAEGAYHVTVALTSKDYGTDYHWKDKARSFQAVRTGPDVGLLSVPITIAVEGT